MQGRSDAAAPRIAAWAGRVIGTCSPGGLIRVSGSLFAVRPAARAATAALLAAHDMRVHVDVIVTPDGRHRGVTLDELRTAREAAPLAAIEVHVILDGDGPNAEAVAEAVAVAIEVNASLVVLPRRVCASGDATTAALRDGGVDIWVEVAPGDDATAVPRGVDGALVMLIRPGTRGVADPALIERVEGLAGRMLVGVDGGVTPGLVDSCIAAGATTIVAGRSLFDPA